MPHLRVALSEKAFKKLFDKVVEEFVFEDADNVDLGPFTASYDVKVHLEGGSVDLRADNTVQVKELDVKWDRLNLSLGVDIPGHCIPGFCLIPNPFGGCILEIPPVCVFTGDPDIEITLPLGGLITSEISITGRLLTRYEVNTDRPAGMDQWEAQVPDPKLFNTWQLFLDPQTVDLDIIDVADTVGDLLDEAIEAAVDGLLGPLPDWLKEAIELALGSIVDLVRALLDIGDDVQEWLIDLLGVSLGLENLIGQALIEHFVTDDPLFELEDPYPILPKAANPNNQAGQPPLPELVPVKIPIRDLTVSNNDVELVLEGSVG
jgi:hypothetical protein